MVHRAADSRLLDNLLTHEKNYSKHLQLLVDISHASLASFSAYASASASPASQAIISVVASFQGADEALRRYAAAVDEWRDYLNALKALEDDVGSTMRDREILVTRLIKASNKQKPTRDSLILSSGSSGSVYSLTRDSSSKMHLAQAELQACEARLAEQERELEQMRMSVVQRGLMARCQALVDCGLMWSERGHDGLAALESCFGTSVVPYPIDQHFHKPLPDPSGRAGRTGSVSDISSILPSQSASQLALNLNMPASSPPTSVLDHNGYAYASLFTPVSTSAAQPTAPPPSAQAKNYTLAIPPAHSIGENVLPQPITEEPNENEEEGGSSAEEESVQGEVHENTTIFALPGSSNGTVRQSRSPPPITNGDGLASLPFPTAAPKSGLQRKNTGGSQRRSHHPQPTVQHFPPPPSSDAGSSTSAHAGGRTRKGSLFGSIARLFGGHRKDDGGLLAGGTHNSPYSHHHSWQTRTDKNLKTSRSGKDDSSSDEDENAVAHIVINQSSAVGGGGSLRARSLPPSPLRASFSPPPSSSMPLPQTHSVLAGDGTRLKKKGSVKKSASSKAELGGWMSDSGVAPNRQSNGTAILMDGSGNDAPVKRRKSTKSISSASATAPSGAASPAKDAGATLTRAHTVSTPRRPNHRRSGSLDILRTSTTSTTTPDSTILGRKNAAGRNTISGGVWPPPHKGDNPQSLMSIVEGVAMSNRANWTRSDASAALIDLRAPSGTAFLPSSRFSPAGASGGGMIGSQTFPPPMVLTPPTPPEKQVAGGGGMYLAQRSMSSPSLPLSNGGIVIAAPKPISGSALQKKPLKSAMRNRSASPMTSPNISPTASPPPQSRPLAPVQTAVVPRPQSQPERGRPITPTKAVAGSMQPVAPSNAAVSTAVARAIGLPDGDDTASIASSYETGHESLGSDTDTGAPPAPPPHDPPTPKAVAPPPRPDQNQIAQTENQNPPPPSTDLSFSSDTSMGTSPARRKSVRMSLQPTFSTTPPAFDDAEAEDPNGVHSKAPWSGASAAQRSSWQMRHSVDDRRAPVNGIANGSEHDVWNDSSDEEGEYSRARKMLSRAARKMAKAGKAGS